jgi:hypothetical protein
MRNTVAKLRMLLEMLGQCLTSHHVQNTSLPQFNHPPYYEGASPHNGQTLDPNSGEQNLRPESEDNLGELTCTSYWHNEIHKKCECPPYYIAFNPYSCTNPGTEAGPSDPYPCKDFEGHRHTSECREICTAPNFAYLQCRPAPGPD